MVGFFYGNRIFYIGGFYNGLHNTNGCGPQGYRNAADEGRRLKGKDGHGKIDGSRRQRQGRHSGQ